MMYVHQVYYHHAIADAVVDIADVKKAEASFWTTEEMETMIMSRDHWLPVRPQ